MEKTIYKTECQLNFHLTQLVTGHGGYRTYPYKYGHGIDEVCPECRNECEMAENIFFICPRCDGQRNCLERTIRYQVTSDNVVDLMACPICGLRIQTIPGIFNQNFIINNGIAYHVIDLCMTENTKCKLYFLLS